MKQLLRHQAILILTSAIVFFVKLDAAGLFNDVEATTAGCSAEMLRTQAWVVPKFNDELRTDAPILVHWVQMTAFRLLGINETAARLPSALFATMTVLLTYHLGRKMYSSEIGFLSGLILNSFLFFSAAGRLAVSNTMSIFFIELSLAGYVWVVTRRRGSSFCRGSVRVPGASESTTEDDDSDDEEEKPKRPLIIRLIAGLFTNFTSTLVMYVPIGLAVLTIGPIAAILPCTILMLFALISIRQDGLDDQTLKAPGDENPAIIRWATIIAQTIYPRAVLKALHEVHLIEGLLVAGAVAVPWFFLTGVSTSGAWLRGYFQDHQAGIFFGIKNGRSGFPFYFMYDAVMILVGCFPWSVFLPVALNRLWERLRDGAAWRESDRLVACWTCVWFVPFLFVGTKYMDWMLPIYPALALVLARYLFDWKRANIDSGVYSFNICCRAMLITGVALALGVAIMAFLFFPDAQWTGLFGFVPSIGAIIAERFLNVENRPQVIRTLSLTAFVFVMLMGIVLPMQMRPYQDALRFVADARRVAKSDDVTFATYEHWDPSLVFYTGKTVRQLNTSRKIADFLASHPHAYVISKSSRYNDLRNDLTGNYGELSRHKGFLKGSDLTLVGRY